jgi:catabolite regulation protein CreA
MAWTVIGMIACQTKIIMVVDSFVMPGTMMMTSSRCHSRINGISITIPFQLHRGMMQGEALSNLVMESSRSSSNTGRNSNDIISATPYVAPPSTIHPSFGSNLIALFTLTLTMTASWLLFPSITNAAESRIVGQLSGSGLVFKDTLQIESFDDPKVRGVTLYISTFQKPITERMTNFFSDPSYASVGCAKTSSTVSIADNINTSLGGEEVFEESRSLLFKTLRVQRIYDVEKKTVVYVSYNTRFDKSDDTNKSRFKSSLCAVNLEY